jgi:hypothetical protein
LQESGRPEAAQHGSNPRLVEYPGRVGPHATKEQSMTKKYPEAAAFALAAGFGLFLVPAHASSIVVEMTTSNGTVPGTSIGYTITAVGDDGGPRNIFPAASSDNGVWTWPGPDPNFPEFLSFGEAETLTVTFSSPVPIDDFVFGVDSTSSSTGQLTLVGGTAGLGDFDLTDSLQVYTGPTGAATYNPSTGIVTASGQNQSLMIGSNSTNTVTSFSYANGASDGGADGYTLFVGFVQPTSVPEPATPLLFLGGFGILLGGRAYLLKNARCKNTR